MKPLTKMQASEEYDRDEFVEAAARAMFVSAWADAMEEAGESFSGVELMDVAPETPLEAEKAARELARAIEATNDAQLKELWLQAATASGRHLSEPTVEDFGHYSAMAALGHGVAWEDDHPDVGIALPSVEFNVDVDPETEQATAIYWSV